MNRRPLCAMIGLCAFLGAGTSPSLSEGWSAAPGTDGAKRVGYVFANGVTALAFACEGMSGDAISVVFGGIAAGLPVETDYPVAVSIDGVAYLQRGRLRRNPVDGGNDLVRSAAFAEMEPMINALKTGGRAEISTPSGRYTVALDGSGKALGALDGGCKG